MLLAVLSILVLLLALIPALVSLQNLPRFLSTPRESLSILPPVSVLIPARNEEGSIQAALESILQSDHPNLEVVVLDDHSTDKTAQFVQSIADRDQRVRLASSHPLPAGWNGKQHACWQLAQLAKHDYFLFLDADVRLSKDAIPRILAEQQLRNAPLISGFPHQETGTIAEKLLIPLMHYVLLSYLPLEQMRKSTQAGFAAGCGQLFFAKRDVYFQVGGHSSIASSRHDGIRLPRAYREAGFATDIFDATDVATCRMYHTAGQVCRGLLKNATEGIANAKLIVPFTTLLLGGSVAPIALLLWAWWVQASAWILCVLSIATLAGWLPRVWNALRFHQSWTGVFLHPLSVLLFVCLQWIAFFMKCFRIQLAWRGRV